MTTAAQFYQDKHGDCEFLSKAAVILFAEQYLANRLSEQMQATTTHGNFNYSEDRRPINAELLSVNLGVPK